VQCVGPWYRLPSRCWDMRAASLSPSSRARGPGLWGRVW
jgi:hypothetical protein